MRCRRKFNIIRFYDAERFAARPSTSGNSHTVSKNHAIAEPFHLKQGVPVAKADGSRGINGKRPIVHGSCSGNGLGGVTEAWFQASPKTVIGRAFTGARIDPRETYMHAQVKGPRESLTDQLRKANDWVEDIRRKIEDLSPRDIRRSKLQTVLRAEQKQHRLNSSRTRETCLALTYRRSSARL
jgi:hypothetical protein